MKKLLPLWAILALLMAACGTSEKQKQEEQAEANEKVDEIIQRLEASAEEENTPAEANEADSTANDSTAAEDMQDHEGHDH